MIVRRITGLMLLKEIIFISTLKDHNKELKMTKKNLCFFIREFPVRSETFVVQQINGLIELGHEVTVIAFYEGDSSLWDDELFKKHTLKSKSIFLLAEKVRHRNRISRVKHILQNGLKLAKNIRSIPFLTKTIFTFLKIGGFKALDELLAASQNNILTTEDSRIIAHFGYVGVTAAYMAKLNILPGSLYTIFHGFEISQYSMVKKWGKQYLWLSQNSALLLPISDLWANKLEGLGVKKEKIKVQHMGIDLSKFRYLNKPLSNPIKLVTVARATEKKGLTYSIEAVEKCSAEVEYHIIGDGDLLGNLKSQIQNYEKRDRIHFHGAKSSEFVAQKLAESDVFVLTSVEDSQGDMEGIPVSLMEAMASGVIVLSTYHSGIPELIINNQTGFLVPERNSKQIASTIDEISTSNNLETVRFSALGKIESDFNQKSLCKE